MSVGSALDDLSMKGAVDWMRFQVQLASPSQFRHIRDRVHDTWGNTFIEEVSGSQAKKWTVKVQNPPGPDQFMRDVQAMVRPSDPPIRECDISILAIEVALDAYHRTGDREALARAVLHMLRHQAHPPAGAPRICRQGSYYEPESVEQVLQALLNEPISIYLGGQNADHISHLYFKTYDTIDGQAYAELPRELWCARMENRFRGAAMPFTTISGWRDFKFESLSKDRFALVQPDANCSQLVRARQVYNIQLGRRPDSYKIRASDRRQGAVGTRRDSFTNDRIRQAFRALTLAQSCQNSVKSSAVILPSPLGRLHNGIATPEYCIKSISDTNTFIQLHQADQSPLTIQDLMTLPDHTRGPERAALTSQKQAENNSSATSSKPCQLKQPDESRDGA